MGKKIIIIAEIMFAIMFVIAMAMIFGNVVNFGTEANDMLLNIQESIQESDLQAYDNSVISGDAVKSLINGMKEMRNGSKLSYVVNNGTASKFYGYDMLDSTSTNAVYDSNGTALAGVGIKDTIGSTYSQYDPATKITDSNTFINPVDKYNASLIFNANGVIIGIRLEKTT